MNYNVFKNNWADKTSALRINWAGKTYVFISRNEEFTYEDVINYLQQEVIIDEIVEVEIPESTESTEVTTWNIPDDKQRLNMFRNDLRMGVEFCAKKYGVSEEQIMTESERVFPSYRVRSLHAEKAE